MTPYLARLAILAALLALPGTAAAQSTEVLYAADGAGGNPSHLYVLDPATGAVARDVGEIGFAITGLAIDPDDDTLYGTTSRASAPQTLGEPVRGRLVRINKETGQGTLVGELFPDPEDRVQTAADITFRPNGTLYGWIEPFDDDLARIDTGTGEATILGDSGVGTGGGGLASDGFGTLYLTGQGADGQMHVLDPDTGGAIVYRQLTGPSDEIPALAFNSAGTLFAVLGGDDGPPRTRQLATIDTQTGEVDVLGESVNSLDGIVFDPPNPEPAAAPPPPPAAAPPARDTARPSVRVAGVRSACVSRNFSIRVRASDAGGVTRVRVFLDGRRIRSTTRRSFRLTIRAASLDAGRHRITVQATDAAGNVRRSTRRFARCAQAERRRAAPRFTG